MNLYKIENIVRHVSWIGSMHDTIQGNSANLGLKSKLGGPPSISELISTLTYARITGSQHWIQASLQQLSPIYTVFLARSWDRDRFTSRACRNRSGSSIFICFIF